jgi:hypothetical protein
MTSPVACCLLLVAGFFGRILPYIADSFFYFLCRELFNIRDGLSLKLEKFDIK